MFYLTRHSTNLVTVIWCRILYYIPDILHIRYILYYIPVILHIRYIFILHTRYIYITCQIHFIIIYQIVSYHMFDSTNMSHKICVYNLVMSIHLIGPFRIKSLLLSLCFYNLMAIGLFKFFKLIKNSCNVPVLIYYIILLRN